MKHRTEESFKSRLNDSMLNSSSALFRSDRKLARTMAGSAGRRQRLRNPHNTYTGSDCGIHIIPYVCMYVVYTRLHRVRRILEIILGLELVYTGVLTKGKAY